MSLWAKTGDCVRIIYESALEEARPCIFENAKFAFLSIDNSAFDTIAPFASNSLLTNVSIIALNTPFTSKNTVEKGGPQPFSWSN